MKRRVTILGLVVALSQSISLAADPNPISAPSTWDISQATSKNVNGTVSRSIAQKFSDFPNLSDYGAVGDGATDNGAALTKAISVSPYLTIPHSSKAYNFTTGSFPGGTYPNYNWSYPSNTGVYSPVGFWILGNNQFSGSAVGDPSKCTGNAFSPYTQPCLVATDYKIIMDPASVWQGPTTTNAGLSIGCLPNHKSVNTANQSGGYNRNWMACIYGEVDTGSDGQANSSGSGFGSSISTEFINRTLDIGTNHGIMQEDNVNAYQIATDGGITRDLFILSSASFRAQTSIIAGSSPWSTNSGWAEGSEINATPFTTTTQPSTAGGNGEAVWSTSTVNGTTTYKIYPRWTRGSSVSGSVDDFVAQLNVDGESGNFFRALSASGIDLFDVDKQGNVVSTGYMLAKGGVTTPRIITNGLIAGSAGSITFSSPLVINGSVSISADSRTSGMLNGWASLVSLTGSSASGATTNLTSDGSGNLTATNCPIIPKTGIVTLDVIVTGVSSNNVDVVQQQVLGFLIHYNTTSSAYDQTNNTALSRTPSLGNPGKWSVTIGTSGSVDGCLSISASASGTGSWKWKATIRSHYDNF